MSGFVLMRDAGADLPLEEALERGRGTDRRTRAFHKP